MHVIKGMIGCLGEMEAVMIKLHAKPDTRKSVLSILVMKARDDNKVEYGGRGWPEKD